MSKVRWTTALAVSIGALALGAPSPAAAACEPKSTVEPRGTEVTVTGTACLAKGEYQRVIGLSMVNSTKWLAAPSLTRCLPIPFPGFEISDADLTAALKLSTVLYDFRRPADRPNGSLVGPAYDRTIETRGLFFQHCDIALRREGDGPWILRKSAKAVDEGRNVSTVELRAKGGQLSGRVAVLRLGEKQRVAKEDLPRIVVERRVGGRWSTERRIKLTGVLFSISAPKGTYRARALARPKIDGSVSRVVNRR